MSIVGNLILNLRSNVSSYLDGVKRAQGANASLKKSAVDVRTEFGRMGRGLIALAGAGSMGALMKSSLDLGDRFQKLSIRLGASTEFLSQMNHITTLSGVAFEQAAVGLQAMIRRVAEAANGAGEAKDALRELNLNAAQLARMPVADQYLAIAEALYRVGDSGDRVRLSMKLFDRAGVALLQTMSQGAEGLRAMMAEADRMGLTMSREMTDKMANANDAMYRMRASMQAVANTIVVNLAPGLEAVANWMSFVLPGATDVAIKWFNGVTFSVRALGMGILRLLARLQGLMALLNPAGAGIGQEWAESLDSMADILRHDVDAALEGASIQVNKFRVEAGRALPDIEALAGGIEETGKKSKEATEELSRAAALVQQLRTPWEVYADNLRELDDLLVKGRISTTTYTRALDLYRSELSKALPAVEEFKTATEELTVGGMMDDLKNSIEGVGRMLEDSFIEGARGGTFAVREMVNSILEEMARLMFRRQIAEPLVSSLVQFATSAFGGGISSLFGFGAPALAAGPTPGPIGSPYPKRAGGGPVTGGRSYLVGERGPEIFTPASSGAVSNGGGVNVTFNISAVDGASVASMLHANRAQIVGMVRDAVDRRMGRGV